MSNTCPNIAQVLSTIDHNSKSVGVPSSSAANSKAGQTGTETHRQAGSGVNLIQVGQNLNNF